MPFAVNIFDRVPDMGALEALLKEYYASVQPMLHALGGPTLDIDALVGAFTEKVDDYQSGNGCIVLAHSDRGALVGCATLLKIRPDAAEMKRLYVRPEAQGNGIGYRLFQTRVEYARDIGIKTLYADTGRGNRPMLNIYEKNGFRYIDRYPENANPIEMAPFLVFLERHL